MKIPLAVSVVCLALSFHPILAAETVRLDMRNKSEAREHAVTFVAQAGELGHAFVIWNKEDDSKKMTTNEALGFYPGAEKDKLEAKWGFGDGQIANDSGEKGDYYLVVTVNTDQFDSSRAVLEAWQKKGNYLLLFSDCTTFAGEVARSLGLKTPTRAFAPYPIEYVRGIYSESK